MEEHFERDLVSALKDVVEQTNWQLLGSVDFLKQKICNRFSTEDGEDVMVVFHKEKNKFYAMDATCPHEGGPLDLGDIEDVDGHPCIVCPWHDFDFRLDNGKSTSGLQQPTYDVQVTDGNVYVYETSTIIGLEVQKEKIDAACSSLDKTEDVLADSLCDWANKILRTADPEEKVRLTHAVEEKWNAGEIERIGLCSPPDQPHRLTDLNVVAPGKIKRGKAGTLASRIQILHSLANIEQWAIDLSWDIIARFSSFVTEHGAALPQDFFSDFIRVAGEEAKHYKMLSTRLQELSSHFGALQVHNGLWQSASETKDSLLARLAVVHMVHEARGLDVHPKTQERFRHQGDEESVRLLEVIYKDEITLFFQIFVNGMYCGKVDWYIPLMKPKDELMKHTRKTQEKTENNTATNT
ncbi:uncharacterized protein HI_0077-like [Anneissia japonica]|uniref:uncharacterized protein HI_0077-like n=1 Tax=Anneissia japonica TaxID=1529436 RepID=UPI0014258E10|nr:uncharacterized protein HI_0077-like [Anneissia japonica]